MAPRNKIFIVLVLVLALAFALVAPRAQNIIHGPIMRPMATGGACATTDTALLHDELLWGRETGDTATWSYGETASGIATDSQTYNTASLTTGKVTGQCNLGWQWTVIGGTAGKAYRYWDRGSTIGTTTAADWIFYLYVQTAPDDGENFSITNFGESTDPDSAQCANVYLRNNSGTAEVQVSADLSSSWIALTANSWNKIKVHFDATAVLSSIAVNDGTAATFTRSAARGIRYIHVGCPNGKSTDDNSIFAIDLIAFDTP